MQKSLIKILKNKNVVITAHVFATGPALDLEEYLRNKVKSLSFMGHPFMDRTDKASFYRKYVEGKEVKSKKTFKWDLPGPLMNIKEAILTLFWVVKEKETIDIYIGSDNYMASIGLLLKKIGKVKRVVFYSIDYVPQRFVNPFLNFLYHFLDKYAAQNSDVVWNVSDEIRKAREKLEGVKNTHQITVPLGIWYDRIPKVPLNKKSPNTIVFMGHLLEKQGLDMVIRALPLIAKKVPAVKLIVVGTGPYENNLKKLVTKLELQKRVIFLGYVEKHEDVEKILALATIAVATYKPDPESFTYFADPGKIKNYLAAGLPVFVTNVPAIAKVIEEKKCGIICEYDYKDIAGKIMRLMLNRKRLNEYLKNAIVFAKRFDWNIIFEKALTQSIIVK